MQVFTSDHALKLEWVPNWVAIIGSGYIGLEFSDVYTALGSEVTFIEVPRPPNAEQPLACGCPASARPCSSLSVKHQIPGTIRYGRRQDDHGPSQQLHWQPPMC